MATRRWGRQITRSLWIGLLLLSMARPVLAGTVSPLTVTTSTPVLIFDDDGGGVSLSIINAFGPGITFGAVDASSSASLNLADPVLGGVLLDFVISGGIDRSLSTGGATQTYLFHGGSHDVDGNPIFDYMRLTWEGVSGFGLVASTTPGGDGMAPTPIPPSVYLMGAGLVGLVGLTRRRKHIPSTDS